MLDKILIDQHINEIKLKNPDEFNRDLALAIFAYKEDHNWEEIRYILGHCSENFLNRYAKNYKNFGRD